MLDGLISEFNAAQEDSRKRSGRSVAGFEQFGYAQDETRNLTDFLQANLRKAVFVTPEREMEVQNGIESLIVGRGMAKGTDYDRETGRVKTSGKESVPDFIFSNLKLCLEV